MKNSNQLPFAKTKTNFPSVQTKIRISEKFRFSFVTFFDLVAKIAANDEFYLSFKNQVKKFGHPTFTLTI